MFGSVTARCDVLSLDLTHSLSLTESQETALKVTGQLADTPTRGLPTRGLDISRTGQVADWTTRGLADAAKRMKTKHAKSPVASASCPVTALNETFADPAAG